MTQADLRGEAKQWRWRNRCLCTDAMRHKRCSGGTSGGQHRPSQQACFTIRRRATLLTRDRLEALPSGKPRYPGLCLPQARRALLGYPPRRTATKARKRPVRVRHKDGNHRAVRQASGASCRCGQGAAAATTNPVRKQSLAGLVSRSVAKEKRAKPAPRPFLEQLAQRPL